MSKNPHYRAGLMALSFALLLGVNLLQRWSDRRQREASA